MKKIYFMSVFVLIALLHACKEDLGNYDYTDTPVVVIDTAGMGASHTVLRYAALKLAPKISIPSGHEAEYRWTFFSKPVSTNIAPTSEVIGDQAVLDVNIADPEGNYGLELAVTDKTTGILSTVVFNIMVTTDLDYGMMVLYETGASTADVDFIKTPNLAPSITEVQHFEHLYSASYGSPLIGNPRFIANARVNFRPVNWITVASDQYIGRFNANNFGLLRDQLDLFRRNNTVIDPQAYRFISTSNQALINGGKLHVSNEINYEIDALFGGPAAGDYMLAPFLTTQVNFSLYIVGYDQKKGRFMRYLPSSHTMLDFSAPQTGQPFDLRNIGKEMLFMGEGRSAYTYSVFKDIGGDKRWLYVTDFYSRSDNGTLAMAIYEMTNLPEVAQAKLFQASSFGAFLYYATDQKIYNYDYSFSGNATEAFTVPAGEQITAMKFYRPVPNSGAADNVDRVLYVASWNGTTAKVYELGLNETSGVLNRTPLNVFEIGGKVIDISPKAKGNG